MIALYTDRSLTSSGQKLLEILHVAPSTTEQVAKQVPYPIQRVRAGLGELEDAKLISVKAGLYQLTEAGLQRISL